MKHTTTHTKDTYNVPNLIFKIFGLILQKTFSNCVHLDLRKFILVRDEYK